MKDLSFLFILFLLVSGCITNVTVNGDENGIRGSGTIISDTRTAGTFDAISATDALNVEVTFSPVASVVVEADDNIVDEIITEIVDGELRLEVADDVSFRDASILIRVTTSTLGSLTVSGSVDMEVTGFNELTDLIISTTGASDLILSGRARAVDLTSSGSSDTEAFDLIVEEYRVDITGSSDVELTATESLAGALSGASDLTYRGDPSVVNVEVTGASDLERED